MGLATLKEVQQMATMDALKQMDAKELQQWIDRAEMYLKTYTRCDFSDVIDPSKPQKLKVAVVLLTEWIWVQNQSDIKEGHLSGSRAIQSEQIGNYSYTIGGKETSKVTQPTGFPELDSLLHSLVCPPSPASFLGVFSVGKR